MFVLLLLFFTHATTIERLKVIIFHTYTHLLKSSYENLNISYIANSYTSTITDHVKQITISMSYLKINNEVSILLDLEISLKFIQLWIEVIEFFYSWICLFILTKIICSNSRIYNFFRLEGLTWNLYHDQMYLKLINRYIFCCIF